MSTSHASIRWQIPGSEKCATLFHSARQQTSIHCKASSSSIDHLVILFTSFPRLSLPTFLSLSLQILLRQSNKPAPLTTFVAFLVAFSIGRGPDYDRRHKKNAPIRRGRNDSPCPPLLPKDSTLTSAIASPQPDKPPTDYRATRPAPLLLGMFSPPPTDTSLMFQQTGECSRLQTRLNSIERLVRNRRHSQVTARSAVGLVLRVLNPASFPIAFRQSMLKPTRMANPHSILNEPSKADVIRSMLCTSSRVLILESLGLKKPTWPSSGTRLKAG